MKKFLQEAKTKKVVKYVRYTKIVQDVRRNLGRTLNGVLLSDRSTQVRYSFSKRCWITNSGKQYKHVYIINN